MSALLAIATIQEILLSMPQEHYVSKVTVSSSPKIIKLITGKDSTL
jgi:hypothetical protein